MSELMFHNYIGSGDEEVLLHTSPELEVNTDERIKAACVWIARLLERGGEDGKDGCDVRDVREFRSIHTMAILVDGVEIYLDIREQYTKISTFRSQPNGKLHCTLYKADAPLIHKCWPEGKEGFSFDKIVAEIEKQVNARKRQLAREKELWNNRVSSMALVRDLREELGLSESCDVLYSTELYGDRVEVNIKQTMSVVQAEHLLRVALELGII